MTKRNNNAIGVLIIIIGIIIFAIILAYGYFTDKNTPKFFNPKKETAAEALYNKITDYDLENNYPVTPDEVVSINLEILRLMYGDMLVEKNIFAELVEKQRQLFGDELKELNTAETQLDNILEVVAELEQQKISCFSFVQLPTIYNAFDNNLCYIRAEQLFNNNQKVYWEYFVERKDNNSIWKITRWDCTDENYEPIVE